MIKPFAADTGQRRIARNRKVPKTLNEMTEKERLALFSPGLLPLALGGGLVSVAPGGLGVLQNLPQRIFRPTRLVIPAAEARSFNIDGIFVGVKIQITVASGQIPANFFADDRPDLMLKYDTAQVSQSITVRVVNVDTSCRFISAVMTGVTVL